MLNNFIFFSLSILILPILVSCSGADQATSLTPLPSSEAVVQSVNGEIYVDPTGSDSASGSSSAPLATIQAAVTMANAGDVIIVRAGIYNEIVTFSGSSDSGAVGNPVTLSAQAGAIIDGTGLSSADRDGLITIDGASHLIINGFEIRNFTTAPSFNNATTPVGILVQGTVEDIEINNNYIHHIENNSSCTQNNNNCYPGANGIAIYGETTGGVKDIKLSGNEVSNCILGSSEAFTLNGNVARFQVLNNYIHDNNNIGLDFIGGESDVCPSCTTATDHARNGIVRGNIVQGNSINLNSGNPWYAGEDGNAGGIYVDGGANILIEQNITSDNDIGIEIASEAPNGSVHDIIIASNLVYKNRELGLAIGGYDANPNNYGGGTASQIHVINNSFYKNRGWGSELVLQYRVTDMTVSNNIFFADGTQSESVETQSGGAAGYNNLVYDTNIWWSSGNIDGIPVTDNNAISADPKFLKAPTGEFRTYSYSPANNAGITIADITSWSDPFWSDHFTNGHIPAHGSADASGAARVSGQIDLGAYEQ
ncbi:MAG: DUF1565 domain-containing protein [bacterium]